MRGGVTWDRCRDVLTPRLPLTTDTSLVSGRPGPHPRVNLFVVTSLAVFPLGLEPQSRFFSRRCKGATTYLRIPTVDRGRSLDDLRNRSTLGRTTSGLVTGEVSLSGVPSLRCFLPFGVQGKRCRRFRG